MGLLTVHVRCPEVELVALSKTYMSSEDEKYAYDIKFLVSSHTCSISTPKAHLKDILILGYYLITAFRI